MKNDDTKNDDTKPGGLVLTRRGFAATGLVTGFALAAGPLRAEVIHTPDTGLDAGEVTVPVSAGKIPAYRAKPAGKTNLPIVLVVQEVFGVHEHIKDICRRFARLGYYAIAPSLYARYGDPGKYGMDNLHDLFVNIVAKVPDSEVMSDCDATLDFAAGDGADLSRLGVTGFCWGGRIVWLPPRIIQRSKPVLRFTASFAVPIRSAPCARITRWIWRHKSRRRCWAIMAGWIAAFPPLMWKRCARRLPKRATLTARLSCSRMRATASLQIIANPITKRMPKPRGRACKPGSRIMVSRKHWRSVTGHERRR